MISFEYGELVEILTNKGNYVSNVPKVFGIFKKSYSKGVDCCVILLVDDPITGCQAGQEIGCIINAVRKVP